MIYDRYIIIGIINLKISILIKIIQDLTAIGIFLTFNDDPQAVPAGFITDINDSFNIFRKINIRNFLNQL